MVLTAPAAPVVDKHMFTYAYQDIDVTIESMYIYIRIYFIYIQVHQADQSLLVIRFQHRDMYSNACTSEVGTMMPAILIRAAACL